MESMGVFGKSRKRQTESNHTLFKNFRIGSAILLGGKLIDIKKLMIVLEKKGMSSSVTYVLLSTTNIIPQMSKKMGAILEAQKSRGIETDSNMIVRAKAFFPSVGPLLNSFGKW